MKKRSLSTILASAAFALGLSGCAGTRELSDLGEVLPAKEYAAPEHRSVDDILRHYFTPEAYAVLKDIPLIDGPTIGGSYAAGVNFWSNAASFVTCNGVGRKVILSQDAVDVWSEEEMAVASILHEYVHHLDDLTRDGDANFIDHREFIDAYLDMYFSSQYKGVCLWVERNYMFMSRFTDALGISDSDEIVEHAQLRMRERGLNPVDGETHTPEQIAYTAQFIAAGRKAPDSMKRVFERIFRREVLYPSSK